MTVAVDLYSVGVAGHVVAVIAAFGVLFAYPWLPTGTPAAHGARERLLRVLVTRGGTVALLLGLLLASDRDLLGEPWVFTPLAILVALLGVVSVVLVPGERRLAGRRRDEPRAHADERRLRVAAVGCAGLVVIAAFLMVTKPG